LLLVTSEQARDLDRRAQAAGLTGLALMEAAAAKASVVAARMLDASGQALPGAPVLVMAGRGNNGGDGIALARHLRALGCVVTVCLCGGSDGLPADAATNLSVWRSVGGAILERPEGELFWSGVGELLAQRPALVVDALLGIGQTRPPSGTIARAVELLNSDDLRPPVLALDVPTGLDASTGACYPPCLPADVTVTFGLSKVGLFTGQGREVAGRIVLASIGLPAVAGLTVAEDDLGGIAGVGLYTSNRALQHLRPRPATMHKGQAGRVLVVAGSPGMTGAAALAGLGALRGGAGLVTLATVQSAQPTVAASLREALTSPLAEAAGGGLAGAAAVAVTELAADAGAVVLGPGLGVATATAQTIRTILGQLRSPLVIDADGLNAFAGAAAAIANRGGSVAPVAITPHPGEAARLLGMSTAAVQADRVGVARRLAAAVDGICLLKGSGTVIATAEGRAYVVPAGNPGMATGGAGDVLSGLIGALWAQSLARPSCCRDAAQQGLAFELTAYAAFLHAVAGDLAAQELGPVGLRAADLAEYLPRAVRALAKPPHSLLTSLQGVESIV